MFQFKDTVVFSKFVERTLFLSQTVFGFPLAHQFHLVKLFNMMATSELVTRIGSAESLLDMNAWHWVTFQKGKVMELLSAAVTDKQPFCKSFEAPAQGVEELALLILHNREQVLTLFKLHKLVFDD